MYICSSVFNHEEQNNPLKDLVKNSAGFQDTWDWSNQRSVQLPTYRIILYIEAQQCYYCTAPVVWALKQSGKQVQFNRRREITFNLPSSHSSPLIKCQSVSNHRPEVPTSISVTLLVRKAVSKSSMKCSCCLYWSWEAAVINNLAWVSRAKQSQNHDKHSTRKCLCGQYSYHYILMTLLYYLNRIFAMFWTTTPHFSWY